MNDTSIWLMELSHIQDDTINQWINILSPLEQNRSADISHPLRKKSYIGSRAMLYAQLQKWPLLNHYSINPQGKPDLISKKMDHAPELEMGLPSLTISHTSTHILCASNLHGNAIGCDIEPAKSRRTFIDIAEQYFTDEETQLLKKFSKDEKTAELKQYFYQMWTAKEAWLKAQGLGIANGLKFLQINSDFSYQINNDEKNSGWKLFATNHENFSLTLAIRNTNAHKLSLNHVKWRETAKRFEIMQTETLALLANKQFIH